MDNHKAAIWCWLQHPLTEGMGIVHIDAHYDTLDSRLEEWLSVAPDVARISFDEFDAASYDCADTFIGLVQVFRYDNYIPIFNARYAPINTYYRFFTQHEGTLAEGFTPDEFDAYNLPGLLVGSLDDNTKSWIINVDLDYFFYFKDEDYHRLYSDAFIADVFKAIRTMIDQGRVAVCTIALSPECCGSWEAAEAVMAIASEQLNLNFELPK